MEGRPREDMPIICQGGIGDEQAGRRDVWFDEIRRLGWMSVCRYVV